ncbi:WxcM-like domain-containing protein [Hyphomicrobium sp. 802]|uniref:WxcM-like domain-containing protein n=1 Tax=Hyphomicrobium sp. 802 TaxID=1112272 RepID=UPI00045E8148|nr:WxcM-like domain-containing protein [Hyphomicrobium sp. 802]
MSNQPTIFVHPHGICDSQSVGKGTRIWAFAHVLKGARIGTRCNICDHVFIENDVVLGNDVTVKCGVQLWDGIVIGDGVFIGPNATFTNDRFPRSKSYPDAFLKTILEDNVSIGANATILPGLRIGRGAMVGAGSVVTRNVPAHATVVGNPAVIVGYNNSDCRPIHDTPVIIKSKIEERTDLGVGGCWAEQLPHTKDMEGSVTPIEIQKRVQFQPASIAVLSITNPNVRTEYARRECKQFIVAVTGGFSALLDDGRNRKEVRLEDASVGLHLAPMVWITRHNYSPNTVLLIAESRPHEQSDYIYDYEAFREKRNSDDTQ